MGRSFKNKNLDSYLLIKKKTLKYQVFNKYILSLLHLLRLEGLNRRVTKEKARITKTNDSLVLKVKHTEDAAGRILRLAPEPPSDSTALVRHQRYFQALGLDERVRVLGRHALQRRVEPVQRLVRHDFDLLVARCKKRKKRSELGKKKSLRSRNT
jgi:hypothetical protein